MVPFARRTVCLVAVLLGGGNYLATAHADTPPNILWLVAEDFGPHLGCYGTAAAHTPRLDALARSGVRYAGCFTTAPVCSPSRSAFMTGMYQTTIGAHHHRSHRDDGFPLPAGVRLVTQWFHDLEYFTLNLRELPAAWGFRGTGKTDWNFHLATRPFDSDRWSDLVAHQPFFAQLNFQETHRPFHAPQMTDPAAVEIPPYYPEHPVVRRDWAQYLDAAAALDAKVGRVLDQLAADRLDRHTVVIFTADNGQAHVRGKQFCYDSGLHVPLLIHWPAGLAPPPGWQPGSVERRLVSAIDLAPTLVCLAGGAKPPGIEGQVFLGPAADPPRRYVFGARDRCDETTFRFRTVRDQRFRLIHNFTPDRPFLQANQYKARSYPLWNLLPQLHAQGLLTPEQAVLCAPHMPEEELYDLQTDPHETRNLVGQAEHQATLDRLRQALDEWIESTHDQGRLPEPEQVAAQRGTTHAETPPNRGYSLDDVPGFGPVP